MRFPIPAAGISAATRINQIPSGDYHSVNKMLTNYLSWSGKAVAGFQYSEPERASEFDFHIFPD
jgi:hypothetical protein